MKKALVLAIALILLLSSFGSASAVTFGEPDTSNRYPFVGTLLFTFGDGYYSCTGSLISPTVMVTAGHCTEDAGQTSLGTWVSFDQEITFANRSKYKTLVKYLNAEWIPAAATPHPDYEDFKAWPDTYDVGVVVLSKPVYLSQYATLPDLGFLDGVGKNHAENAFTTVGYGMQGYIQPFYSDIWARYFAATQLVELNSTWNGNSGAKFTNNPGIGGGTCYGDSGGPTFYKDTNILVAVTSWGNTPCIGVDFNFRTDTAIAQDFLLPFLTK